MRNIFYILCIVALLLTNRIYAQQWHTTLDVMIPAEKSFPKCVTDLLLVNNSIVQPNDFGHAHVLYGVGKDNESIDLSQAAFHTLFEVTKIFDYSDMFSSVGLVENSLAHGSFFASNSINSQKTDSLRQLYSSQTILSLDRIIIYDILEEFITDEHSYGAELAAFATTMWTLVTDDGNIQSFSRSDTLYWIGESADASLAIKQLPDRQTALLDMARYAGEQFAMQFIPKWETVDRYIYENNNQLLKEGLRLFTLQHWNDAIVIWQQAFSEAKGAGRKNKDDYETRAYAAANIAVAQEILGNIAQAKQWAKASADNFDHIDTADAAQQQINLTFYLRQLTEREKDEMKLSEYSNR